MDRFEDLKAKYKTVLDQIPQMNVRLANVHVQDNKLFIKGAAPSEAVKNRVWDAIKQVDPSYSDLTADITIDSSIPEPAMSGAAGGGVGGGREYTVQAGDSLWKIAQNLMGNGSLYPKIIAANPGKLKDENSVIHPGDKLMVPSA